jgi:hypothetical protein
MNQYDCARAGPDASCSNSNGTRSDAASRQLFSIYEFMSRSCFWVDAYIASSTSDSLPFPPPLQVTMSIEQVPAASRPTVTTDLSTSQYDETFGPTVNDFESLMGQDYKPTNFESAEAVLKALGETVKLFEDKMQRFDDKTVQRPDDVRAGIRRLETWLESYVDILFTVSATLWETTQAVSLTHDSLLPSYCTLRCLSHQPPSPEKTICNAIVVLIKVSLFQKVHARVPVMTIMTIISRPLMKLKRDTTRLWISSIVFNITSNVNTIPMVPPSSPTKLG